MALRDIRELKNDPEAYAAELEQRWTGLLSYRYIGRNHGSMNTGEIDNTVTLRRDMRNATGGLLVAPHRDQLAGGRRRLRPRHRPEPGDPLVPDHRSRARRHAHRGHRVGGAARRRADGLQPLEDRRRRRPRPGHRLHGGAGREDRRGARGTREDARGQARDRRLARPPTALAGLRRVPPRRRPLGAPRALGRARVARRRAPHRSAARRPGDRRDRRSPSRSPAPTSCRCSRGT